MTRRRNEEIDTRIRKANALVREIHLSAVTKRELSNNAKLSVFKSVFVPILTYGHDFRLITERILSPVQVTELGFCRSFHGLRRRDKVCSCEICKALKVVLLLNRMERSQLRWHSHVSRSSQEKLARHVLLASKTGKLPRGHTRRKGVMISPTLLGPVLVWSQQTI